jgi:hypothetical protein
VVLAARDFAIEIVELGRDGAEDDGHLHVEGKALGGDGVQLFFVRRVGDVEVMHTIEGADAVAPRFERMLL